MKTQRKILLFAGLLCVGIMTFCGCTANRSVTGTEPTPAAIQETGYISDVAFNTLKGKEQVTLFVSQTPEFTVSRESDSSLLIKLENMYVPEALAKKHDTGSLENINSLSLSQQTGEGGKQWVQALIKLDEMVPYRVAKNENALVVTFDVSALEYHSAGVPVEDSTIALAKALVQSTLETQDVASPETERYTGQKISLNFQDASIKSVFRSISEVSGYNIVAGPGVEQKVTVFMKDVPWDQALDTLLEINGLGKKTTQNVITVLPLEELKKAEEEQQKKDVVQGKLRQIAIEAKIVEISTSFARDLGVRWGYGYQNTWGGRDYGVLMGNSTLGSLTSLPGDVGLTQSNVAVNFPGVEADMGEGAPGIGIIVGADKFILDAKLDAVEQDGKGKIISSPKVTTLDNVKATIKQGQEIPYAVTDDEGNRSIEFKDAALLLEVKPTITPEGKISMEVKASNDYPDWTRANVNNENPPINTNSVESTVLVNNGDTLVVGGVYKMEEQNLTEGVPWLSKVPALGWLFKYKSEMNEKREILIFVTPRIIQET
ncbi:MAG: secretin and TonB N-terminal domain-containing protein [Deltaproteobacteria bacterium]|nr:secretin and TonB N-terminal domain-containing protein [Deltaproteobacteria bacterium]